MQICQLKDVWKTVCIHFNFIICLTRQFSLALPTLPVLLSFKTNFKTLNLAQQIGMRGEMLGVFLLQDESGAIVEGIAARNRSVEDINREILTKWLQGSGKQPVTWSTLTACMRQAGLFELAAQVDGALNVKETRGTFCPAAQLNHCCLPFLNILFNGCTILASAVNHQE